VQHVVDDVLGQPGATEMQIDPKGDLTELLCALRAGDQDARFPEAWIRLCKGDVLQKASDRHYLFVPAAKATRRAR